MQGTVNKVWHNHRADGSEFWVLSVDGQRYSTWDRSLIKDVREGDPVEFAFTHSGRYRSLTALKRLPGPPSITSDRLGPSPASLRIVRMNCLRTAAEMLKDTTLLPEQKVSLSIAMAKTLEKHVMSPPETGGEQKPENQSQNPENKREAEA